MAVIVFESRVNMQTVPNPVVGGYVIAYDTADGLLKQKDSNGVITLISGSGSISPLNQVLALGNRTGTSSIVMDQGTVLQSSVSGGQIKLDNGILNSNYVSISTDNNALLESYLLMNATSINIKNQNSGLTIGGVDTHLQYDNNNKLNISSASFSIVSGGSTILQFNNNTTPVSGSKISGIISSENSYFSSSVSNSLILGGNNIIGSQSNTIYTPNLYVSSGIIGNTMNSSKLKFTTGNEIILDSIKGRIGILSSTGSNISNLPNGIFLVDTATTYTSPNTTYGVIHIGSKNVNNTFGLQNTVIVGGDGIVATASNTVYLGGTININNEYNLPLNDGGSGQYLSTDGNGNLLWNTVDTGTGGVNILLTSSEFRTLAGEYDPNTTYIITDAEPLLYGGTTIYLSTDANGVLNTTGLGKFFNPKYNRNISGFGIYINTSSYSVNDHIIWGGYVWKNITGTNNTVPSDAYTLSNEWTRVDFNDSTVSTYYTIVYDIIKYDISNDRIVYRSESNINIVDISSFSVDFLGPYPYSAIKAFQWGNQYDYVSTFNDYIGIGNQRIINSINENINFIGTKQYNIYLQNSLIYSLTFNYGKEQINLTLVNSTLNYLILDYNQNNITLDNYNYDRTSLPMIGNENDLRLFGGSTILDSLTIPTGASAGYVLTSNQDGLSYWTASIGYDENAVHLTGNETITDTKTYTDNSINTTAIEGLKGNTTGTLVDLKTSVLNAGGTILNVSNSDSVDDSTDLLVLNSGSASTGIPFIVQKNGDNVTTIDKDGNLVVNTVSKTGGLSTQYLMADGSVSTGTSVSDATTVSKGIVQLTGDFGGTADAPTTPTALHKTGDETFTGVKIANNTGDTLNNGIVLTNSGTTNSVSLSISTGTTASGSGQNIYNYGIGNGLYIENRSGVGSVYNSTLTGDLIQFKKNNVLVSKFDQNGRYSLVGGTSSHFLTSDGGTASILVTDATTTVKGIVKLAGDLGGTADLPTTPTALHKTGNETFTGIKTGTNTTSDTKINLINNGSVVSRVLEITNNGSGYAQFIYNSPSSTSSGLMIQNNGTASNSKGLEVTNASYNGYGIYLLSNTNGIGQFISNGSTNAGLSILNVSTGIGVILESSSLSSSDLIQFKKNGILQTKFDQNGRYSIVGGTSSQYLMADGSVSTSSVSDATTTLKGVVKLAGDLGGTADLPTTPTALHITGNESFTGIKSANNTGPNSINGISLQNSGTGSATRVLEIYNSSVGYGQFIFNQPGAGTGLNIQNQGNYGIFLQNASSNTGLYINNGSGTGLFVQVGGTGSGVILNSILSSSADILQFSKNGVITTKFDQNGRYSIVGGTNSQYLMADGSVSTSSTPDATTTLKGIVKLAGDLGGTADLPTTPTALHKTGAETFSGIKFATNTGIAVAGLSFTQTSASSTTQGMIELIKTGSNSPALSIVNNGNAGAAGMHVVTTNSVGININGTFSTVGSSNILSTVTGTNPSSSAFSGTSDGPMTVYIARQSTTGTGYNYLGYSASNVSFSVDKAGNIIANSFARPGGTNSQYLMADGSVSSGSSVPDATTLAKGVIQLTGDLGGFATAPTTPTALHKTGNESFTGFKTVDPSSLGGIRITQSPGYGGVGLYLVQNGSAGSSTQAVLGVINNNDFPVSAGAAFDNNGGGYGVIINNKTTGKGLVINSGSTASGFNISSMNASSETFTLDRFGNVRGLSFVKTGGTNSQYLMADGSVSLGVQLVGDLGGTPAAPTTPTALHKTGDEQWIGVKSAINNGGGVINGLSLTNNGGGRSIDLINSGSGASIAATNSGTGASYMIQNNSTGHGYRVTNNSSGQGFYCSNNANGQGVYISMAGGATTSTTVGVKVYSFGTTIPNDSVPFMAESTGGSQQGLVFTSVVNGITFLSIEKTGNITAGFTASGPNSGIITANKFKINNGTSSHYLMADGATSSGPISGSYSPLFTNISNITGTPTVIMARYTKINNLVTATIQISATSSASTGPIRIYAVSLPIPAVSSDIMVLGVANIGGGTVTRVPVAGGGYSTTYAVVNFDTPPNLGSVQTIQIVYNTVT